MNKKLSILEVFAIVLGAIIGWGAFMLPGTKFLHTAGAINTGIGLLLGACCIAIIERSYHVMMEEIHEDGGEFSYVYRHMGNNHGFVVGWALSLAYLTMIPLNATAFPLVINKLFEGRLHFGYLYSIAGHPVYIGEILVSLIIILLFMSINLRGLKSTGRLQKYIIFCLIICIVLVFGGMWFVAEPTHFQTYYLDTHQIKWSQILQVFAITPFLYVGFDAIPQLANNLGFSTKKASILAVFSLMVGMLIYNILNITTALVYTPEQAIGLEWALGSAVLEYIGQGGFLLLVCALGAAVCSGINGFMICSTKLIGAMGEKKVLHKNFSSLNDKGALSYAIVFVSIISFIATFFGREVIIWIVDMSSLGAAIAYFYVCLIAAKSTNELGTKRVAWIGVACSMLFILLLLVPFSPASLTRESLIALFIWCMIGYGFWKGLKQTNKS